MTDKQSFSSNKNKSEIVLYQTPDGKTKVDVRFEGETAWLNQTQIAELFESSKQNVSLHINNIFKEGELERNSVVKDNLTTAADGKKYTVRHYNLDVIISTGNRRRERDNVILTSRVRPV